MGYPVDYQPHKLIVAVLVSPDADAASVLPLVEQHFGKADDQLPARPFTFSSYYDAEMGSPLSRTIFSVGPLVDPSRLASFKDASNRLERETARPDGTRALNLDPGLLSLSRVILATTKASAHRIPLTGGLHAEITLLFRRGRYAPLEWTYPDFQSDEFVRWLGAVRRRYHEQLKRIDPERAWRL